MWEDIRQYFINTGKDGKIVENNLQEVFSNIVNFLNMENNNESPKKLLLYCHGGLVPQSPGWILTEHHYRRMLDNNIYPIYFVWESGMFKTLQEMFDTIHTKLKDNQLIDKMKQNAKILPNGNYRIASNGDLTKQKNIEDILVNVHQSLNNQKSIEASLEDANQLLTIQTTSNKDEIARSFFEELSRFGIVLKMMALRYTSLGIVQVPSYYQHY